MSSDVMMTLARTHQAELRMAAEHDRRARAAAASDCRGAADQALSLRLFALAKAGRRRISQALVLGRASTASTPSV